MVTIFYQYLLRGNPHPNSLKMYRMSVYVHAHIQLLMQAPETLLGLLKACIRSVLMSFK